MRGQISALWIIKKVDFLKLLQTPQAIGFIMSLGDCSIFCKFEVYAMHSELCSFWITRNVGFQQLLEKAQTYFFRVPGNAPNCRF